MLYSGAAAGLEAYIADAKVGGAVLSEFGCNGPGGLALCEVADLGGVRGVVVGNPVSDAVGWAGRRAPQAGPVPQGPLPTTGEHECDVGGSRNLEGMQS